MQALADQMLAPQETSSIILKAVMDALIVVELLYWARRLVFGWPAGHWRRHDHGAFLTLIFSSRGFPTDIVVKLAIATSLSTILFTSISSVRAHYKRGAVRLDLLKTMGLAPYRHLCWRQLCGSAQRHRAGCVLCALVGYSALQMLRGKKPKAGRTHRPLAWV